MRPNIKSLIILLLLSPVVASAQARPSTCEVRPLWVGPSLRSSTFGPIGRFQAEAKEGPTIHSFRHEDTKLVITVGIDYDFEYSKSKPFPALMRLAIRVSDKEETEVFESVDSAEASTRYVKKWNLSVSKNINFENKMIYIFTLSCWDGAKTAKK